MKKVFYILEIILIIYTLSGCTNILKATSPSLEEKVDEETEYLDSQLIAMLNSLNNITYTNYKVISTEVKQNNSASNPNNQMNQSGKSKSSEQKDSQTTSGESSSSSESESKSKTSKMESNTILNMNNKPIEWDKIKSDIEILYNAWITTQIDLKELGVSEELINAFSNELNSTIISIKNEDKTKSMQGLVTIYGTLYELVNQYSKDNYKTRITETKKYVLEVYNCIEQLNWEEANINIGKAEQKFEQARKSQNVDENKKVDIERVYVLIKELKKSLEFKDREVALLKYKDLIQELSIL